MTALHVRLLKKLEAGKGGMTLERHDLDLLACRNKTVDTLAERRILQ